ncbi:MAG: tRNA (adenosine(37)-N6)-threonylcarbamoyltransferase complex ATPase subunit type 1 TsaE [Saprospiraceae bacterium]
MSDVLAHFDVADVGGWKAAWEWLSPKLADRKAIALIGDLGAGKTTFVKTIVAQLGSTDAVTSPTFSIVQEYEVIDGTVYHFDLYRMESIEEVLALDFEGYLDTARFTLIEWPEIAAPVLPKGECMWLRIEHMPEGGRRLLVL